jgi:hypothetical protein
MRSVGMSASTRAMATIVSRGARLVESSIDSVVTFARP